MIIEAIIFIIGIILLVKGADYFVGGGSGLAARFGVSAATIGFTVIAFGTSLPEFVVSVNAIISHDGGIALGNVLGSNIANIALVLALCAIINPKIVGSRATAGLMLRETWLMLAATVLFLLLAMRGAFDVWAGAAMLIAFVAILAVLWRGGGAAAGAEGEVRSHGRRDIILTLGGLLAVIIGAQLVVDTAVKIAGALGVPTFIIGLSIVAIGTSLPELATSIVAIMKNEGGISVGNILGSNIFNLLFVMGVGALISPVLIGSLTDVLITAAFSAAVIPLFLLGDRMTRLWAAGLLAAYALYIGAIFGLL
ncbi:calcium/sodium antiporter [Methanofollis aquaemaris]|uniref:Calcium/sodium antiporter n=1 Tax=Methanofollis aquaemaris TaxID=126734 RepID=A0A8A3S6A5_9EURY|nr:calcium/sodium antiporter [Methanofollis aquaemaris]QSZ67164.1 calcium/sodium antiporter [Methanofollis aquaemaris]